MRWWRVALVCLLMVVGGGAALAAEPAKRVPLTAIWGGKALLLEDRPGGEAETFDGKVEWRPGRSATGAMTLSGTARFPGRTLQVNLLLAENEDKSLPATHLFEVSFRTGPRFVGGSVAKLSGMMFKDEPNGIGVPLTGAAALVEGSRFLFALKEDDADLARTMTLLGERDFLDLAVIYSDGRRAVLTLAVGGAKTAFSEFSDAAFR